MCGGTIRIDQHVEFVYKLEQLSAHKPGYFKSVQNSQYQFNQMPLTVDKIPKLPQNVALAIQMQQQRRKQLGLQ